MDLEPHWRPAGCRLREGRHHGAQATVPRRGRRLARRCRAGDRRSGQGRRHRAAGCDRGRRDRGLRWCRPPGEPRRHQPGVRAAHGARPPCGARDHRGLLSRRAVVDAAGPPGPRARSPWCDRQRRLGRRHPDGAGYRPLRRQQGDADPPDEALAVELVPNIWVNASPPRVGLRRAAPRRSGSSGFGPPRARLRLRPQDVYRRRDRLPYSAEPGEAAQCLRSAAGVWHREGRQAVAGHRPVQLRRCVRPLPDPRRPTKQAAGLLGDEQQM